MSPSSLPPAKIRDELDEGGDGGDGTWRRVQGIKRRSQEGRITHSTNEALLYEGVS